MTVPQDHKKPEMKCCQKSNFRVDGSIYDNCRYFFADCGFWIKDNLRHFLTMLLAAKEWKLEGIPCQFGHAVWLHLLDAPDNFNTRSPIVSGAESVTLYNPIIFCSIGSNLCTTEILVPKLLGNCSMQGKVDVGFQECNFKELKPLPIIIGIMTPCTV